MNKTDSQKPRI